jgi:thioredoxin reductase
MKIDNKTTVAIVGGGPAGCSAAIQLKRSGIEVVLFEKDEIGGLSRNANLIENYLGFPKGISGKEFVELIRKQMEQLSIPIINEEVKEIIYKEKEKKFIIQNKNRVFLSKFLVVATGTIPKKLQVSGEEELHENGLLFYQLVDIESHLRKNKKNRIGIIGGGDVAFDYALNLSNANSEVIIYNRGKNFRCLPLLYTRVKKRGLSVKTDQKLKKMESFENHCKLYFQDGSSTIVDFVLVAIGRKPNDHLIKDLIHEHMPEGMFLIGDLVNENLRQISIAVGDGIKAAMTITKEILEK